MFQRCLQRPWWQVVNGPVSSPIRTAVGARTDAPPQQSHQAQSRIVHAKPDCPLHQVREALSSLATHRVRHTASWLLPPGWLCCDHQALSESHQVIRRPLARLPPCFVIHRPARSVIRRSSPLPTLLCQPEPNPSRLIIVDEQNSRLFKCCLNSHYC
jgi:hypothetical protein